MARLESNAKMGYYPTPQKTLEIISTWIQKYRYEMTHVLDPCAGTGEAITALVKHLRPVTTYGIELDMERAIKAQDSLDVVAQGSIFDARVNPLGCMGLLYLNPPYDTEEGERLEMKFLKHAIKWLAAGGVLMFLVPEYVFDEQKNRDWIGQHFRRLKASRIHADEFDKFKQVLVCGIKNAERTEMGSLPPPPYPYIIGEYEVSYTVPKTNGSKVFQGTATVTDEDVMKHTPIALQTISRELGKLIVNDNRLTPILKPRLGHLVSQITGGALDGELPVQNDMENHIIVKGYSERNITVTVDEEAMRETTRETYATGIRVIEYNNKGAYWYDVK